MFLTIKKLFYYLFLFDEGAVAITWEAGRWVAFLLHLRPVRHHSLL